MNKLPLWVSLFFPTDEEIESHKVTDASTGSRRYVAEDDGNVYRVFDDGTRELDLHNVMFIEV